MKRAKRFIKMSDLLLILAWAVPAQALNPALAQLQEGFSSVAAKAKPAVVNIQVIHEQRVQVPYEFYFGSPDDLFQEFFQGQPRQRETLRRFKGTGTGVIINADGYVLTNEHVVSDAGEIDVTLTKADGKQTTLPGKVVGTDPGLDLAVVKIQTGRDFPFLRLADSDKVKVGDWAVAIGSPFELQQTVTVGVISAVRQSLLIEGRNYANMLQTDAAINRGNSGGPLLNLDGDVIGINTAIYSPSGAFAGIGFSVPANEIREVLDQLVAGKKIARGWLGIQVAPIDEVIQRRFGLPDKKGALVGTVFQASPAEKAGLQRGDVIVEFAGQSLEDANQLTRAASKTPPGKSADVVVMRSGGRKTLKVEIGERPEWAERGQAPSTGPGRRRESSAAKDAAQWEGVSVTESRFGVIVVQVARDSKLYGHLEDGDVIQGVNQQKIDSVADFKKATREANLKDGVVFDLIRGGQEMYISVQE